MARNRFCTGCGETFTKTHFLHQHRRLMRCGGKYLPPEIREIYDNNRRAREAAAREERVGSPYRDLNWGGYPSIGGRFKRTSELPRAS